MRYAVIIVEGGLIQNVKRFKTEEEAIEHAEKIAPNYDPEADDVAVWDLDTDEKVLDPFREDGDEEEEEAEGDEEESEEE